MDNEIKENNLSVNRQEDLENLLRFLKEEVRVRAEENSEESILCIDEAIDILSKFGKGYLSDSQGIILRSMIEDALGYNAVQLKISHKEVEIAHIIKYLCASGQKKTKKRLYYLDCNGHCENYMGSWNGVEEVIMDIKNFFNSNNWKFSSG